MSLKMLPKKSNPETETLEVKRAPLKGFVINAHGIMMPIPKGWDLLPPGDATLSRRIKKDGPSWTVKVFKKGRLTSQGIWASRERIEALRAEILAERKTPTYKKKLETSRQRSAKEQAVYADEFTQSVFEFLNFHPRYESMAKKMATRIATHAVPVGSGTVARTKMISIEKRSEAATIAWMRHQTTAYDEIYIPRIKGERSNVRAQLAKRSRTLLNQYRNNKIEDEECCPLYKALR